jgi:hypothetical protein
MAKIRYYLQNANAPYTPATWKGGWNVLVNPISKKLDITKSGVSAERNGSESSNSSVDVGWGRWVSNGLAEAHNYTTSDTIEWVIGVVETNSAANYYVDVTVWITAGDSDTVRGYLCQSKIESTELPTTAQGQREGPFSVENNVSAQAGDRIVVEIGFRSLNTTVTVYTGTITYGGTGSTDLTEGSTNLTTEPGWIEIGSGVSEYDESVTDGIKLSDSNTVTAILNNAATDGFKLSDSSIGGLSYNLSVTDGFKLSDSGFSGVAINVSLTDGFKLSDTSNSIWYPSGGAVFEYSVYDGISFTDNLSVQQALSVIANDTMLFSDSSNKVGNMLISVVDGIRLSDTASTFDVSFSGRRLNGTMLEFKFVATPKQNRFESRANR